MDERQATLLALQATSIVVLLVSCFALYRALRVWWSLKDKDGGELSLIVLGVLSAFVFAQALSVFNVFTILVGEGEGHQVTRLAQQIVLVVAAVWASTKLSHIS